MRDLLSRYAEATFWLARYVERAENLARILDVNETFSRNSQGEQNWRSVLQLFRDEERFLARNDAVTAEAVIHFYTLDSENPGSILSSIRAARENARSLRPLISTEMWIQINIFHNNLKAMKPEDASEPRLARFCTFIKEACQAHTGITEGTFHRDAGWYFYQLGHYIERADQTTRMLDVKYHLLLPDPNDIGSPVDVSQWNALLRSASGYHAFRRVEPSGMSPKAVAGFLLLNLSFPRSVRACVTEVHRLLDDLRRHYQLTAGNHSFAALNQLREPLESMTIDAVIDQGLHEFIDATQSGLIAVSKGLARDFFGLASPNGPAAPTAAEA